MSACQVAASRYLISPDGDRPECYRHYEAIGLGTVPITEMDPILFRHLAPAPVIFNTTNWNLKALEAKLDPNPVVDRNLISRGIGWNGATAWWARNSIGRRKWCA
ncbi:hypothetical protein ACHAWF_017630 [Thalassiosira exigua]